MSILSGENASVDEEVAKSFYQQIFLYKQDKNYCKQVFNVNETELFLRKLPTPSYIARDGVATSVYKVSKDTLTLLLGCNASGDFKIRPLLVYHSYNL